MGKTIEKVKMWNIVEEENVKSGKLLPIEVDAQIDNGATEVILTEEIATSLKLMSSGKTKVKYADERIEERKVGIGLRIEIMGRNTVCRAIVEPRRKIPLIGQIVLESLDLWINSKNGRLIPNPESPDSPLMEILSIAHW